MDIPTNYALHDEVYKDRRGREDYVGWDDAKCFEEANVIVREVMAWPEVPRSGRLLEIGCGAGNHLVPLAPQFDLAGMDISPTAVEWANERAREAGVTADVRVGDVRDLPWDDASFDVVRDGHLLHCIIGDDRPTVLAEARRVLKPGGTFMVFTMCGDKGLPADQWDPATRLCMRGGVATRYVGYAEDIEAEVRAAGFEIVRSEIFPDPDPEGTEELVVVARKPE